MVYLLHDIFRRDCHPEHLVLRGVTKTPQTSTMKDFVEKLSILDVAGVVATFLALA